MEKIIISLVDFIIEQKKLQFLVSETTFDEQLFAKHILKIEANEIFVNDFRSISSHFVLKYKEKLNFKLSDNFQTNANFIKAVNDDFTVNGYVHDYHNLEKEIWKYIVKVSNFKNKCTFSDYLSENKPNGIYDFIDAYSALLTELDLSVKEIFENAVTLAEITKRDATYNIPLSNVLSGIKNKCKTEYENGVKLLYKSLKLNEDKENIISAIVSGLYESKRNEFYESELKELINKKTKISSILFGLSNVSEITISDCELFIRLINEYVKRETFIIPTLSIVFSILKSNNTQHHYFCFNELKSSIENEKTAYYILNNLSFIQNYSQEKTDIIVKLVNQEYFTIEKYINSISQIFWHLKGFEFFKKVILSIINNKPFEKFIKAFQSFFHTVDAIELDRFTIELLIDNSANKRHTGIEIFDELSFNEPYRFSFNILDLPSISQYKLLVALTQGFHEPQKRLTAILPLVNSKSDLVKESLICKLEEISEDYGGHVTTVLENNLDQNDQVNSKVVERVKKYIEDFFSKNIDIKRSILELNPHYIHYSSIKKYNEFFSKKISKTVEKGKKENSFLSIFGTNTVYLAKGGGWRFGAKKEISQLGQFGASFAMPRCYFINPNEFEISKSFDMRQDWSDQNFLEIKMFLENEQQ